MASSRDRVRLPVLEIRDIARRELLVLGAVAAAAACRADADIGMPDSDNTGDDTGTDDVGGDDVVPQDDTGTDVMDAATDTGTVDAGRDAARDVSTMDVQDSSPPDVATCTAGRSRVGMVSNFPVGTWHLISSPHVIVAQDSGGLYCYSSVCTHAGCIVDPPNSSGDAYCACHGSLFNGNGGVINGPATTALRHYKLTVCMSVVYVDTSMSVSSSTRTPPTG